MAKSPDELMKLTPADEEAVKIIEEYIDKTPEMAAFDGYEFKIAIPSELYRKCFKVRTSIRTQELLTRYRKAGWKEVGYAGNGENLSLFLSRYVRSYGSGRD
jgi:hypothetical protein